MNSSRVMKIGLCSNSPNLRRCPLICYVLWLVNTVCNRGRVCNGFFRNVSEQKGLLKTTLGWSGTCINCKLHTRTGSYIKQPIMNKEATLEPVDWGVVHPKVATKISLPILNGSWFVPKISVPHPESRVVGPTKISVYAPLNRQEEAAFSLDTAAKCIQIFNNFFGIDYCLPKLDLIALACLSVGAMENWGLVTFR